ncbi:hypothetical protein SDC9_150252 [bioreactor metagenome]|uniref:Uncharacterized protein n=1 Tax=bioreactor metagenome TaxID=1076179 RepID=A0A645EPE8_9ZZZZ
MAMPNATTSLMICSTVPAPTGSNWLAQVATTLIAVDTTSEIISRKPIAITYASPRSRSDAMCHQALSGLGSCWPRLHRFCKDDCSSTNTPVAPDSSSTKPATEATQPSEGLRALDSAMRTTSAPRSPTTLLTCASRLDSRYDWSIHQLSTPTSSSSKGARLNMP